MAISVEPTKSNIGAHYPFFNCSDILVFKVKIFQSLFEHQDCLQKGSFGDAHTDMNSLQVVIGVVGWPSHQVGYEFGLVIDQVVHICISEIWAGDGCVQHLKLVAHHPADLVKSPITFNNRTSHTDSPLQYTPTSNCVKTEGNV
jgi:hypothetical protein